MADVLPTSVEIATRKRGELGFVKGADYHPPEVFPTVDLFKKISPELQTKILEIVPEAYYPLSVLSLIEPEDTVDIYNSPNRTRIPSTKLQGVKNIIFNEYLFFSDIGEGGFRSSLLVKPIVDITSKFITQDYTPPRSFKWSLRIEADKEVVGEKGYESITGTGGYHEDWKDISNCEDTPGSMVKKSAGRFILNFLQNQVKYDQENKDEAQKLINIIDEKGWASALKLPQTENLKYISHKAMKDDSYDFCNNRLVKNKSGDFVLRKVDLKNEGLNAIMFRCFSKDGQEFVDIPAPLLLSKSNDQIELLLTSGDSNIKWRKSEEIEAENPLDTPLCNLFISDAFPNHESKLYKYRGNRGRSMGIGVIDLKEKGKVFTLGGSHLMIDGMGQSRNLRAHLYDIQLNKELNKKVEFPPYIIFPPLPRVEQESDILEKLGLSDFVIIQDFDKDGNFAKDIKKFNDLTVVPKKDKLKKTLLENSFNEDESEKLSKMFTQFLSRSTLVQMVGQAYVGRMMNVTALREQKYHRLGMAITKSLESSMLEGLKVKNGKLVSFFDTRLSSTLHKTLKAIDHSRMEVVSASLGVSVLGGIQSLLNIYRESVQIPTGLVYSKMLDLSLQTGFFSDKGKEDGDIFITAQNHQEKTMGLFIGMLGNTITARVNIEYPQYFNSLNIEEGPSDEVKKLILENEHDPVNLEMEMVAISNIWRGFAKDKTKNNVEILEEVYSSLISFFGDKSEVSIKALKLLIISSCYQNILDIKNSSYIFINKLNKATENEIEYKLENA